MKLLRLLEGELIPYLQISILASYSSPRIMSIDLYAKSSSSLYINHGGDSGIKQSPKTNGNRNRQAANASQFHSKLRPIMQHIRIPSAMKTCKKKKKKYIQRKYVFLFSTEQVSKINGPFFLSIHILYRETYRRSSHRTEKREHFFDKPSYENSK